MDFKTNGNDNFELYILERLNSFKGKSLLYLFGAFNITGDTNKGINAVIIGKMLGIDGQVNQSEEFEEAGIKVKTISVRKDGKIQENLRLSDIVFKELANEEWYNSNLRNELVNTRYLLAIFKEDNDGDFVFNGAKLWDVPENDIDSTIRSGWEQVKNTINEGVTLTAIGNRITNNLLKRSDGKIIHVRPHAINASYMEDDSNTDELPVPATWINKPEGYSDIMMTKQAFWINKEYLQNYISDLI